MCLGNPQPLKHSRPSEFGITDTALKKAGIPAVTSTSRGVLRTAARAEAYDEDRTWIGFHVEHTDDEVAATSLRWWRCDPKKVIDNQIYAVTVSTIPVAVYAIYRVISSHQRPTESGSRYHFDGKLLARLGNGPEYAANSIAHGVTTNPILHMHANEPLSDRVQTIMNSRITVNSGGPIGYLEAEH